MVSEPAGVVVEVQVPVPPDKVAVHSVVDPEVKVTVPVGVPVDPVAVSETVAP